MDISFFCIWSMFNSLSEIIRSKNPYVQLQMLQCTISPRILNQLGHGDNVFFICSRFNSLSEIIRSKNPYVQFQMLQCTISPIILNQLGYEHKDFYLVKIQFIIRNYQIKKPLCPITNDQMYNIANNTKSAWTWT
jgi:hypothetical protein